MNLLLTAFGPFDGRRENASALVLARLRRSHPGLRTRLLPVDAVVAPARLRRALHELRPDAVVMLGESGGCREIRLETTAWNELDFRIPDVAGRRISSRPIHPDGPPQLASTLPLGAFQRALEAAGHPVARSADAGRYLCNQLFYTALRAAGCPAGFVHLPLAEIYPTERATDAVARLLDVLRAG